MGPLAAGFRSFLHREAAGHPVPLQMEFQVAPNIQVYDLVSYAALEYDIVRAGRHGDAQRLSVVDPVFVLIVDHDLHAGIDGEPLAFPDEGHHKGMRTDAFGRWRNRLAAFQAKGRAGDKLGTALIAKHNNPFLLTNLVSLSIRQKGRERKAGRRQRKGSSGIGGVSNDSVLLIYRNLPS